MKSTRETISNLITNILKLDEEATVKGRIKKKKRGKEEPVSRKGPVGRGGKAGGQWEERKQRKAKEVGLSPAFHRYAPSFFPILLKEIHVYICTHMYIYTYLHRKRGAYTHYTITKTNSYSQKFSHTLTTTANVIRKQKALMGL